MRIVDAYWEKRNMGINAVEVTLEAEDDASSLRDAIDSIQGDYCLVRVAAGRIELNDLLSRAGFVFIESIAHVSRKSTPPMLKENQKQIFTRMALKVASPEDENEIFSRVQKGLFSNDRISLDPHFTKNQAANRCFGMLNDAMRTQGAFLYRFELDDKIMGFACVKPENERQVDLYLYGLFPEHSGRGLGFGIPLKLIEMCSANGTDITSRVSTNNLASLSTLLGCGFRIDEFINIFVKHHEE